MGPYTDRGLIFQFLNILSFLFSQLCLNQCLHCYYNPNFPKCHQPKRKYTYKVILRILMLQILCLLLNKAGHQCPLTVCLLGLFWSPREVSREVTGDTSSFQPLPMSSCREITGMRVAMLPGPALLCKCQITAKLPSVLPRPIIFPMLGLLSSKENASLSRSISYIVP